MTRTAARDDGDFPTPAPIAAVLARETLTPLLRGQDAPRVLDPACGEGALLVASASFLATHGKWAAPAQMVGVEIDASRARGARRALRSAHGTARIVCGDALSRPALLRDGTFDAVVANPPFLSPTARRGALSPRLRQALKQRLDGQIGALTNIAAIFLADAMRLVRPGGRVGMILPQSFLTSRDAAPVRAAVLREGTLEWLWTEGAGVFPAAVTVCGLVVRRGGRARATIRRARGPAAARVAAQPFDVSARLGGAGWKNDAPAPGVRGDGATIGSITRPISGFRRHFYAVAEGLVDAQGGRGRPVVTAGLIDPGRCLWGRVPARIAGTRWAHPRLHPARMAASPAMDAWLQATAVPKVMVATQTRVIECIVDDDGQMVPGVPVVALPANPDDAWRIAAALTSPALSHLAFARHAGAALSADAIKMSGAELAALPLPTRMDAWEAGAGALRAASSARSADEWRTALEHLADAMGHAYRGGDPAAVRRWWDARLPPFRGADAAG